MCIYIYSIKNDHRHFHIGTVISRLISFYLFYFLFLGHVSQEDIEKGRGEMKKKFGEGVTKIGLGHRTYMRVNRKGSYKGNYLLLY